MSSELVHKLFEKLGLTAEMSSGKFNG